MKWNNHMKARILLSTGPPDCALSTQNMAEANTASHTISLTNFVSMAFSSLFFLPNTSASLYFTTAAFSNAVEISFGAGHVSNERAFTYRPWRVALTTHGPGNSYIKAPFSTAISLGRLMTNLFFFKISQQGGCIPCVRKG